MRTCCRRTHLLENNDNNSNSSNNNDNNNSNNSNTTTTTSSRCEDATHRHTLLKQDWYEQSVDTYDEFASGEGQ